MQIEQAFPFPFLPQFLPEASQQSMTPSGGGSPPHAARLL